MSSERYIELYSRHRNRTRFPNPSSFEVPFAFSQPLGAGGIKAFDPVLNGMVYFSYQPTSIISQGIVGVGSSDSSIIIIPDQPVSRIPEYYTGAILIIVTSSGMLMRTIIGYQPTSLSLTPNVALFGVTPGYAYFILSVSTPSFLHFPLDVNDNHVDLLADDQGCTGYYVIDETLSYGTNIVARLIIYYDVSLRYAYFNEDMPAGWSSTDRYTIRRTLPSEKWTISAPSTMSGGILYLTLPDAANASEGFYVHQYVYFYQNDSEFSTYRIVSYDGFQRKLGCIVTSFSTPFPTQGDTINIVSFSHDNFSPLSYIGSIVSQNQAVCYEVMLTRLALPNVNLRSGSRVSFYPYVYVEFSNMTSPTGFSRSVIYSNNPESQRALFLVPVRDMVLPVNSNFVKLVGRMRQIVKFKPNDSFRFSVFLPDGSPFLPVQNDLASPYEPNNRLQINAVFAFRRLF